VTQLPAKHAHVGASQALSHISLLVSGAMGYHGPEPTRLATTRGLTR
jgi:hypothetical protein